MAWRKKKECFVHLLPFPSLFDMFWNLLCLDERNGARQEKKKDQLISCGYTTTYQVLPVSLLE